MRYRLHKSVACKAIAALLFTAGFAVPAAMAQSTNEAIRTKETTVQLRDEDFEKIRLIEVSHAAKLYTKIAFSNKNKRKMRGSLPLAEAEFQTVMAGLSVRFEACMESGFEARMANAFNAQVLRKTMQSVLSVDVPEPEKAQTIIPAFKATDKFCAARVKVWMAAAIK